MSGSFQFSGPCQSEPEYRASLKSGHSPVKLSWFQRWFLKHSQQAWQHSSQISPPDVGGVMIASSRAGRAIPTRELNTRNSIDMSLIKADGGWIVQFTSYDEHKDRHNVHHYVITDSEEFGNRLAEIITLQCMR